MKIKALAALCKKRKSIIFWDDSENRQFVSDYGAVYPLDGLPWMSHENLLTVFDVPEKDRDKWLIASGRGALPLINLDDADETEKEIDFTGVRVIYGGYELIPLYTSEGVVYINAMHLNPLMDVIGQLTLHERKDACNKVYIVAKVGLLLQAVILPMDIVTDLFVDTLTELGNKTKQALKKGVKDNENNV